MTHEAGLTWLRAADYRRMRWKNGGGWTTELALGGAPEAWGWRVSVAEVDADCEFSRFPGIDRSILVLAGEGMALQVEHEAPALLRADGEALAFSGDRATRCRLLGGPTRDFNVMTRRGEYVHTLTRGAGARLERGRDREWLVYVWRGAAQVGGLVAPEGDCVRVDPGHEDSPAVSVSGTAGLALVIVELRRQAP